MIESLLIANRGEIARRVIRTARRLGVRTIAVYSSADANALHVRDADCAVHIGGALPNESYLAQDRILAAARDTGAQAIHPGYGFLSENADFADAVKARGLVWVGPPASSIRAMGAKDASKQRMLEAGVPVTPGYHGADQSLARLEAEASAIGYPVLIKAVAGGGGKGMRRVEVPVDFASSLLACQREAASAFADPRVLLEKYVSGPRHVEVQVFADRHGNVVHLFERDCSLQRRHQKVIEEAPAPGMDAATREAVCGAAVRAAKAVGYEGAGTVEFIADASAGLRPDRIYFMEMNTRLQVEHPVTEAITGQDLVEWQLRIASGEPLPRSQDELSINGHAMEARLYAENPASGFLPSTGTLRHLRLPQSVRVDSGVEAGNEISAFYDPMLAKLIAHAPTRRAAAANLAEACASVEVWPVKTNAGLLARALSDPDFIDGQRIDTSFIEARRDRLIPDLDPADDVLEAAASARVPARGGDPWTAVRGFRLNSPPCTQVPLRHGEINLLVPLFNGPKPSLRTIDDEGVTIVFSGGEAHAFTDPVYDVGDNGSAVGGTLNAPMPGRVIAVAAIAGEKVVKGQKLITLEAMKMEHTLAAAFDGTITEVRAMVGDIVSEGTTLAIVSAEE